MSGNSHQDSGSVSASVKSATVATTCEDTMSVASSRVLPPGPYPTPAHTLAGDIPSNDFFAQQLGTLDLGTESSDLSTKGLKHVESNQSEMSTEYPEASKWEGVAEEDVTRGLQRLVMVAEDEHKEDPSKSVEHYYSLRLAKIVAAGAVKFDASYLKK